MTKTVKIAITIGLMVVWALLLSVLESSDFPLPVLTFVFILIILGLWAFGKTPNASDNKPTQKGFDSEKPTEVSRPVFTLEKEKETPSIQKQVKKEPMISSPNPTPRVSSDIQIEQINKDYVLSLLREKCHPRLFMQQYDPVKVSVANKLFASLTDDCSLSDLDTILSRAKDELNIDIDTTPVVSTLLKACSPEIFMEPYDAEKIEKANKLYSKIIENKSNLIGLIQLKEEAINNSIIIDEDREREKEYEKNLRKEAVKLIEDLDRTKNRKRVIVEAFIISIIIAIIPLFCFDDLLEKIGISVMLFLALFSILILLIPGFGYDSRVKEWKKEHPDDPRNKYL